MFKIILWATGLVLVMLGKAFAQNSPLQSSVQQQLQLIELQVVQYKDSLKNGVDAIWALEDAKQITPQQAQYKKDSLAQHYSHQIKVSVASSQHLIDNEIKRRVTELINNQQPVEIVVVEEEPDFMDRLAEHSPKFVYSSSKHNKKDRSEKRTTSQLVFAFGVNSLLENGDLKNGDFTPLRSMFYELGYTYNTRLSKNSPLLHFKYGFSFMFDKLSPRNNYVFVRDDNGIFSLEPTGINYKKNMFRNTTLVVPLHLEFDFTKKRFSEKLQKNVFASHQAFRFGIGGFFGTHLQTLQKFKYREDGKSYKEKFSSSYNVEKFIYGLSAYVGYKQTSFYVKYNLNPLFKKQPTDVNLISAGLRFDFN
ncbi:hypothetical protein K5I29_08980 [Flavobacterium agricola]|uniref:Outer membrane protein beta-barrel domain-containing protein n=1 Tax=Flavobacterium agricola TaxID=2870839 RepID=A0ABY6LWF7_9FLAO|nr:hypothetical protein [Flavobacterium agricola]UYW00667.1 hypothetical protein K5I29_08980 [Flavobacterium agricola]